MKPVFFISCLRGNIFRKYIEHNVNNYISLNLKVISCNSSWYSAHKFSSITKNSAKSFTDCHDLFPRKLFSSTLPSSRERKDEELNNMLTLLGSNEAYKNSLCAIEYSVKERVEYKYVESSNDKNVDSYNEELDKISAKDWSLVDASEIIDTFITLSQNWPIEVKDLEDERLVKFVHNLAVSLEDADDFKIVQMLECLGLWPLTDSYLTINFACLKDALDHICCSRIEMWKNDFIFLIANFFTLLGIQKITKYLSVMSNHLFCSKNDLSKEHLIQLVFYLGRGKFRLDKDKLEGLTNSLVYFQNEITINELSVIANGLFKMQMYPKNSHFYKWIINSILDNKDTIDNFSLANLLKLYRNLANVTSWRYTVEIVEALMPELSRFNVFVLGQINKMGTRNGFYHEEFTFNYQKILLNQLSTLRLKDILNLISSYYHNDSKALTTIENEMKSVVRETEIQDYLPVFLSCLEHFHSLGHFSETLINRALDQSVIDSLEEIKRLHAKGRCLALIDCSIDVEFPTYEGNRLDLTMREKFLSNYHDGIERKKRHLTQMDKIIIQVEKSLIQILGYEHNMIKELLLLPYLFHNDFVFCTDKDGYPIPIPEDLLDQPKFSPKIPSKQSLADGVNYNAILVANKNMVINSKVNGRVARNKMTVPLVMKLRQLQILGYKTIMIPEYDIGYSSGTEKNYINVRNHLIRASSLNYKKYLKPQVKF